MVVSKQAKDRKRQITSQQANRPKKNTNFSSFVNGFGFDSGVRTDSSSDLTRSNVDLDEVISSPTNLRMPSRNTMKNSTSKMINCEPFNKQRVDTLDRNRSSWNKPIIGDVTSEI